MRLRRHYHWTRTRGALWDAHRVDRDRTCARLELGERAFQALCVRNSVLSNDWKCS